ncbi:MAG: ABC transporter permease [Chitinophagaceae bacterium]|nr:ABC transporter permease [Chitinophagaceae bacterium]
MNIVSFIARRIVFQKNQSFSRFIIRLSAAATAISVAIMIMALAFVAGFQQAVSNKVFSFWGHIRVQQQLPSVSGLAEDLPSYKNDTIEKTLQHVPQIKWVDVFATKSAMLKTTESIEGVLLKGVDASFHTERIAPYLINGKWLSFDTSNRENPIVISAYTAKQLQLKTGGKAFLYFIESSGSLPKVRPVTVCGIYKTSIEEYDKTFAIVDLHLIQKINDWKSNQMAGYEVTLNDYRKDKRLSNQLLDSIPTSWYATPVREIYPNIFDWLNLQNTNRIIVIVIMCIVAIMNLITCLLILVLERSRMIGLLKATGASNMQVQKIFWQQGIIITVTGVAMGTLLGLGLCWLQQTTGFISLDESAYYVAKAPVKVIWWQVVLVDVITFIVSLLVLLIPSLLVRKISPVKALRFE